MGTLYLVATPIGNLEDITLRAIRILSEVFLIAAEDTRTTRKLLSRHGIRARLASFHQFSGEGRIRGLVNILEHDDVALVSDAGMPAISDPGYPLVRAALEHGFPVVGIPGPSAVLTALAVSGLPTHQFVYLGFLPRKPGERRKVLASLGGEERTVVAFESPHRMRRMLEDMTIVLPARPLALCRELTKVHEEIFRGDAAGALEHFVQPRGEFTVVIGGAELRAVDYWKAGPVEN
jgi:16S rRNA (cytidine1402-2'-O)-methyltransferase